MTDRLRAASEALFVLTEALAWYVVLRVLVTLIERSTLDDVAAEIERNAVQFVDATSATEAVATAARAADALTAGPPLWVVLPAAGGAYLLSRAITRARLGGTGAVVGLLISFLALNLLFHLALAGDIRVWDNTGLASFLENPQSPFSEPPDPVAFVANPDPTTVEGRSYTVIVFGLLALWLRFLVAGRGRISFERVLRSFSVGFPIIVVAVFVASASSVGVGVWAVGYFVLGVLALAVANGARTPDLGQELSSRAPWALSVVATLGLLAGVALLAGLLAAINVGAAFELVGGGVMRLITFVLVIVLTPIFWVVERLLGAVLGNADLSFLDRALENARILDPEAEREPGQLAFPGWIRDLLRLLGIGLAVGLAYLAARFLFRRYEGGDDGGYVEEREEAERAGLGGLLRNLLPAFAARSGGSAGWVDRHPVYRLYARVVGDATERRFAPRPGETPLEFARASAPVLAAREFIPIAEQFDRARYGRHFPAAAELEPLAAALEAWEVANPVTEEIRERPLRGELPPDLDLGPQVEAPDTPAGPLPPPF